MFDTDLHVHTNFCDGENSPEEMINVAISIGLRKIGLVCHSYVDFDDCCASIEDSKKLIDEVNNLKLKYSDQIEILLGVEQDYYSEMDTSQFDYVIGSVHYVKKDNEYLSVDLDKESFMSAINNFFAGNVYYFVDEYYKLVAQIKNKTNCNIIGHFDLITKFNEKDCIFDTSNPRYIEAWKSALDQLKCKDTSFEINYGAVLRGYRQAPYPSSEIVDYIKDHGGKFIYSSDAHSACALAQFAELS